MDIDVNNDGEKRCMCKLPMINITILKDNTFKDYEDNCYRITIDSLEIKELFQGIN